MRARVKLVEQVLGVRGGRLAIAKIRQVGPDAGGADLGERLVDVVARHALAVAPSPVLVGSEPGPSHLLGVAGDATQVLVDQLPLGRLARHPLRKCGLLVVVVIRSERAQLRVRAKNYARPGNAESGEKAHKKDEVVLHDAGVSIAEGSLNQAGAEMFRIRHEVT
jgi:hypothetical protein